MPPKPTAHASTSATPIATRAEGVLTQNALERDIDAMLRKSQPGNFSGEGKDIGKVLEDWIERMDDYFDLAQSTDENKAIIARFKLEKTAKRWWKDHCQENHLNAAHTTWPYLKSELIKNYQNKTYHSEKMNDFLDSTQGSMDLEAYYQHFLTLIKYAPTGMTQEVKVARFVSGLQSPFKERLQALRLTTFTDVLEAGKPIEKELNIGSKRKVDTTPARDLKKVKAEGESTLTIQNPLNANLRDKARRERLCYICMDPNHQRKDCPIAPSNLRQPIQYVPQRNFVPPNPRFQRAPQYRPILNQPLPFINQRQPQRNFQPGNPPFRPNNPPPFNANPPPPRPNLRRPNIQNVRPGVARANQLEVVKGEEQPNAHIHAAIEHQGANQQFSVLQTPAEYQGKTFTLLIDSGSTHSFLSPRCVRNLSLHEYPDSTLTVELATDKKTQVPDYYRNPQFLLRFREYFCSFQSSTSRNL